MLKRTVKEFQDDNLTDWAAALTYYGVLAIFPALLVLVSVLGLIGTSATQPLLDNLGQVAPGPRRTSSPTRSSACTAAGAPPACCSSSASRAAIWSASGYIGAFMRASNAIYEVEEGRPFWKRARPARRHDRDADPAGRWAPSRSS